MIAWRADRLLESSLPGRASQAWPVGLQIRLRGPCFRRLLIHGTIMGLRRGENLFSRSRIFALTAHVRQAPKESA